MDSDGLPLIGPGLDYTKIGAIHQKRTLAFLNHFISHTANFLNRFSCTCEDKLSAISLRIQRLETTMAILEAKLNSVPGLEGVTVPASSASAGSGAGSGAAVADTTAPTAAAQQTTAQAQQPPAAQQPTQTQAQQPSDPSPAPDPAAPPPPLAENVMKVSQDPRYAKYFKMQAMGVPSMAVKNKMTMEGLNPALLDTPDAPAPSGTSGAGGGADDDDDFSDDDADDQAQSNSSSSSDDFSD